MTAEEAEKVIEAILEGGGFADRDVADSIIEELVRTIPETDWRRLAFENDAALAAEAKVVADLADKVEAKLATRKDQT